MALKRGVDSLQFTFLWPILGFFDAAAFFSFPSIGSRKEESLWRTGEGSFFSPYFLWASERFYALLSFPPFLSGFIKGFCPELPFALETVCLFF